MFDYVQRNTQMFYEEWVLTSRATLKLSAVRFCPAGLSVHCCNVSITLMGYNRAYSTQWQHYSTASLVKALGKTSTLYAVEVLCSQAGELVHATLHVFIIYYVAVM